MVGVVGGFKDNEGGISSLVSARDLNRSRCLGVNGVAAIAIILYIILGLCVFVYSQDMSPVDSVYLSMQTLLTIGYGDVPVQNRSFHIFYRMYGAGLCLAFFSILTSNVMEKGEAFERERLAKVTAAIGRMLYDDDDADGKVANPLHQSSKLRNDHHDDDDDGNGVSSAASSAKSAHEISLNTCDEELHVLRHQALIHVLHILLVLLVGAAIMAKLESWSFNDGIYWATATITSVGYGDVSPQTVGGRVFFIFYAPLGCAVIAKGFADLVRFPILLRQKISEAKVMAQFKVGLSERVLSALVQDKTLQSVPRLQKDRAHLEKSEFAIMLLVIMDKLSLHDLMLVSAIFDKIWTDATGKIPGGSDSGTLSLDKLREEMHRAREREVAERLEDQRARAGTMQAGLDQILMGGGSFLESGLVGVGAGLARGVRSMSNLTGFSGAKADDDKSGGELLPRYSPRPVLTSGESISSKSSPRSLKTIRESGTGEEEEEEEH